MSVHHSRAINVQANENKNHNAAVCRCRSTFLLYSYIVCVNWMEAGCCCCCCCMWRGDDAHSVEGAIRLDLCHIKAPSHQVHSIFWSQVADKRKIKTFVKCRLAAEKCSPNPLKISRRNSCDFSLLRIFTCICSECWRLYCNTFAISKNYL